jgi:hypothetical protein
MESTGRARTPPQRPVIVPLFDTLNAIRAEPALIEHAVRTALVDAMKWRLGGGTPPNENAFAFAAVAAARQERAGSNVALAQRSEPATLRGAAAAAALRLFRAQLGKRLMTLPSAQIVRTGDTDCGADVVVRDTGGRLHLIALTALSRPLDISARAREVAEQTHVAARDRLSSVRVHMFSLATGARFESHNWSLVPRIGETRSA